MSGSGLHDDPRGRRRLAWALAGLLCGCAEPPESTARMAGPRPAPVVETSETSSEPTNESDARYVAVVIAPHAVDLAAEVAGTLREPAAVLGEHVEAGARLARVQAPTLPAEIEAAEAALAQAEAARAEQALRVEAAERMLEQERRLSRSGASTEDQRDQARLELALARAAGKRIAAQRAERQAELQRLRTQLERGQLRAPFSGTVARWYRSEGAVVSAGEPVLRLVAVDRLWVRFAVPVEDLPLVRVGATVRVLPDAGADPGGWTRRAVVRHVAPELDLASQQMLVEAELVDGQGLTAGQACTVSLRFASSGADIDAAVVG
ncbi:MAG: efflux RND transporter periplasmic adaptor subunit [Nannocystaceae bacterium]